jgi:hypothetical protein
VAESTAPVTGHKLTLLEYTGFQYMLRVPEFLVGGVFTPPKTDSIPLTLVPKSGLVHAASRHRCSLVRVENGNTAEISLLVSRRFIL